MDGLNMTDEKCSNCKYAKFYDDKRAGDCRINPPSHSGSRNGYPFPKISRDGWCGRWKKTIEDTVVGDDIVVVSNKYVISSLRKKLEEDTMYHKEDIIKIVDGVMR
jgi:hypothetical protein